MAKSIPAEFLDLFEKPAFAHLATLMPDGTPQITPVWVDYDGQYIIVNSTVGRRKNNNMAERPQVALEIVDPDNPYRYITIRGRVAEITEEGAKEHVDKLARKYLVTDRYTWAVNPDEVRQIFKIQIDHVLARLIVDNSQYTPK